MIKVIFVCHGNYHRSPMAHGLFQKLVIENKLQDKFFCDSAGTACTYPGQPAHSKTLEILNSNGFNLEHKSRIFKYNDLRDFDYVIAMDHFNLRDILYIKKLTKQTKENIYLMRQFDPEIKNSIGTNISEYLTSGDLDVPDPEVLKLLGYEKVHEIINHSVNGFFNYLQQENKF